MTEHESWLWPDRVIYRRESRTLREEHNALVNSHAELLAALEMVGENLKSLVQDGDSTRAIAALKTVRAAIAKAKEQAK